MSDLFATAIRKRQPLPDETTDALRLIDGIGDGLPGVFLETFADRWLVSTLTSSLRPDAREWLAQQPRSVYWKRLDQHQKDSPAHLSGPETKGTFLAKESGLNFEISFESGYSQGIFLDQRDNRAEVSRRMGTGLKVLNTFAYTGAFSVFGAAAGAETTTLDLSQPYLDWAKRNFIHNDLDPSAHHFCKGDTFHWLRRFAKQGRKFDGIILDPPTFSRDEKGKVFRVENDFGELAALAASVLSPDGWILCSTNFKKLPPKEFERQLLTSVPRRMKARHTPMPSDFTGEPYLKSVWLEW